MDLFITPIQFTGATGDAVIYEFWNAGVFTDYSFIFLDMSHSATPTSRKAALVASYTAYAVLKGYTISQVQGLELIGGGSSAHISDGATNAATNAATNLPTNFNLISGTLGIANGLNDANSGQNDLATKYNDLATKYNALGGKLNSVLAALQLQSILLP